jgi:transposase InsO family protein
VAQEVFPMTTKLLAALLRVQAGHAVSVSAVCVELGISRQTFYKYRRRFEQDGIAGVTQRSRRPGSSPTVTPPPVVDAILRARKELEEEGWDNGATSIWARLMIQAGQAPAVRTIHRVLVRQGVVVPEPGKRPRSSFRSFVFPATDDCWQIDGFGHRLADGTTVCILQIVDDHSRYEVSTTCWPDELTGAAWQAISLAIERYGRPRMVLSDNGLAFTGRRINTRVLFERNLELIGVRTVQSSPRHPRTCGKNERLHRTLQQWLAKRSTAATLAELQTDLDTYQVAYNQRPHQALGLLTPREARTAGIRHVPRPDLQPCPRIAETRNLTLDQRGCFKMGATRIALGIEHAGNQVSVYNTDGHILIFAEHRLLRELTLDPDITYYPRHAPPRARRPRSTPTP